MLKKVSNILITGRGVFAERKMSSGEFLVEYRGELLSSEEGERRGEKNPSVFRYFFQHGDNQAW